MKLDTIIDLYNQFTKIHNQFALIKRKSVITDGEQIVYPAEMQVLSLIYSNPFYTSTEISKKLYITKSATSQIIKKLVSKEYLSKFRGKENERVINFKVSDRGKRLVEKFMQSDANSLNGLSSEVSNLSENELETIKLFMNKMENIFDKKLESKEKI